MSRCLPYIYAFLTKKGNLKSKSILTFVKAIEFNPEYFKSQLFSIKS